MSDYHNLMIFLKKVAVKELAAQNMIKIQKVGKTKATEAEKSNKTKMKKPKKSKE